MLIYDFYIRKIFSQQVCIGEHQHELLFIFDFIIVCIVRLYHKFYMLLGTPIPNNRKPSLILFFTRYVSKTLNSFKL